MNTTQNLNVVLLNSVLDNLLEALNKIERNWILNPEADLKHIRRDIVDAINVMVGIEKKIAYEFDPTNPPSRHDSFVAFWVRAGKIKLKVV